MVTIRRGYDSFIIPGQEDYDIKHVAKVTSETLCNVCN